MTAVWGVTFVQVKDAVALYPLFAFLAVRFAIATAALAVPGTRRVRFLGRGGAAAGAAAGDLLVLAAAAVYSLQIVLMERFAPRYDVLAFTFVEMAAACAGLGAVAVARAELGVPHGWTVWGALLVTGVFASALGFLVQTWAQRRTSATRTALAFTMEPVFAALFGITLAGDRLGALGWTGCAAIMAGVVLAEPAAADALRKVLRPA